VKVEGSNPSGGISEHSSVVERSTVVVINVELSSGHRFKPDCSDLCIILYMIHNKFIILGRHYIYMSSKKHSLSPSPEESTKKRKTDMILESTKKLLDEELPNAIGEHIEQTNVITKEYDQNNREFNINGVPLQEEQAKQLDVLRKEINVLQKRTKRFQQRLSSLQQIISEETNSEEIDSTKNRKKRPRNITFRTPLESWEKTQEYGGTKKRRRIKTKRRKKSNKKKRNNRTYRR
jgi:hypothetical protein